MSKAVLKELPVLVAEGIITPETSAQIEGYYKNKLNTGSNRLVIVFGILGALLVGLGIILIIAHNWDTLPKTIKLVFALLPLLLGQILTARIIFHTPVSVSFREATATFLVLSIGAAVSMVSQIYNIQGDLYTFLLVWTGLSIPVIYVLQSSFASLLVWVGATAYSYAFSFNHFFNIHPAYYFVLLAVCAAPHYILLLRNQPNSNFTAFHNWVIVLSLILSFGNVSAGSNDWMVPGYASLFGIFIIAGKSTIISSMRSGFNAYTSIGFLGTIIFLLISSFIVVARNLSIDQNPVPLFMIAINMIVLFFYIKSKNISNVTPSAFVSVLFIIIFIIAHKFPDFAKFLINVLVLTLSLFTIREGSQKNNLGILNYGLLILTALIICRFFDTDISFVLKGVIFIVVGAGFFILNYMIIQRKRNM